jgi:hypothetical protein
MKSFLLGIALLSCTLFSISTDEVQAGHGRLRGLCGVAGCSLANRERVVVREYQVQSHHVQRGDHIGCAGVAAVRSNHARSGCAGVARIRIFSRFR